MRCIFVVAGLFPVLAFGQASSQVQTWTKDHFGVQIEFPGHSYAQNYARVQQPDGTFVYQPSGPNLNYSDPACKPWQDAYSILNVLPRGAWVRAGVNLWEHFLTANSAVPEDYERFQSAVTGKVLFPNLPNTTDGLNLLWVMVPGIPNRYSNNDGWFDNPLKRDWYVPAAVNRPYLKQHVQKFVTAVNNFAVDLAKTKYTGKVGLNVPARIGFQLGNEVGAAHPGGSVFGNPGTWTGMGQVMQDTTAALKWRPDDTYAAKLSGGTTWTNPLNLPAFSFLTEARNQAFLTPDLYGQVQAINWPGAYVPGLNEVFTYYDEMYGPTNNFTWANQCTRRSVHYRSPQLRWIRANDGQPVFWPDLLDDNTINGRWETAAEYAKRWTDDMSSCIKGYARLSMPGNPTIVDLTECYLTYGELDSQILDTSNYQFSVNGVPKSTDQIRYDAQLRGSQRVINGQTITAPMPPTRIAIFAAIRDEVYARAAAGKLPNLGRIYWVNAYTADPRRETGFPSVDPINSYNPWADFRLTVDEIKVLYGLK